MRHLYLARLFLALLAASFTAKAALPDTEALIKQVETRYNGVRTLSVNFVETYSLLGHKRPPETGVLTLRKQGKMRWDYRRPQGKLFISDGKSVFLYTAADNRVEKVPLRSTEDMRAPLAFLLGRLDMKKEFQDFATRQDVSGGGTWLNASARNDKLPFKSIDMLITPGGSIRQLIVTGRDESLLSYAFENEKLNIPVNDASFHFVVPPGAEVVNAVEFQGGREQR
jgi:outer membrane lipoprotein carrier protein